MILRQGSGLEFRFAESSAFREFPALPVQAPILADVARSVVYAGTFHVRKGGPERLLVLDNSNRAYAASSTLLSTVQALLERELGVKAVVYDSDSTACQLYSKLLAEGLPVPLDFQREERSGQGVLAYRLVREQAEFLVDRAGTAQWTTHVAEDDLAAFLDSLPETEQERVKERR